MSDVNLIIDKIREELEKGLPSKRKILAYLVDLLNKDKYSSLSDFEFYDIVGDTYKLILNYKLNLKMLFTPVYKDLKKKIRRLYGDEKRLEMEQHLLEKFGLTYPEKYGINRQIKDSTLSLPEKVEGYVKYGIFLDFIVLGLIIGFFGMYVYITSSEILGITFMILGLIVILYGLGVFS